MRQLLRRGVSLLVAMAMIMVMTLEMAATVVKAETVKSYYSEGDVVASFSVIFYREIAKIATSVMEGANISVQWYYEGTAVGAPQTSTTGELKVRIPVDMKEPDGSRYAYAEYSKYSYTGTITLPEGYAFYDDNNNKTSETQKTFTGTCVEMGKEVGWSSGSSVRAYYINDFTTALVSLRTCCDGKNLRGTTITMTWCKQNADGSYSEIADTRYTSSNGGLSASVPPMDATMCKIEVELPDGYTFSNLGKCTSTDGIGKSSMTYNLYKDSNNSINYEDIWTAELTDASKATSADASSSTTADTSDDSDVDEDAAAEVAVSGSTDSDNTVVWIVAVAVAVIAVGGIGTGIAVAAHKKKAGK